MKVQYFGSFSNDIENKTNMRLFNAAVTDYDEINGFYQLFEIKRAGLSTAIDSILYLPMSGANIDYPFQEEVVQYMDHLDDSAKAASAVDVILPIEEELWGYYTMQKAYDIIAEDFSIQVNNLDALVFGANAEARSLAAAMADHGVSKIYIAPNENEQVILEHFQEQGYNVALLKEADLENVIPEIDVIINTENKDIISNTKLIKKQSLIIDNTPQLAPNSLLEAALKENIKIINGADLAVYRMLASLELWTGKKINTKKLYAALDKAWGNK